MNTANNIFDKEIKVITYDEICMHYRIQIILISCKVVESEVVVCNLLILLNVNLFFSHLSNVWKF